MSNDTVLFTVDARGVAEIVLNRPEVHNAFDDAVIARLIECLDEIASGELIRCAVLRSNGRHFSAGADLNWMKRMASLDYDGNLADAERLATLMSRLNDLPVPVLSIVQGAAYAGALGLICCSDHAIASPRATFCVSEVKLGLSPAVISPYVVRVIGERAARRYFLSAEVFDASEALRIGLVQTIADEGQLAESAKRVTENWLAMGPSALRQTKALIRRVSGSPIDDDTIAFTRDLIARVRVSTEGQEGLAAFFEKRKPDWQS